MPSSQANNKNKTILYYFENLSLFFIVLLNIKKSYQYNMYKLGLVIDIRNGVYRVGTEVGIIKN